MKPYSSYKDTGIAWIGQIPSHWEIRKMKFCFNERVDKNHPQEVKLSATQTSGVIPQTMYEGQGNRVVNVNTGFNTLKLVKVGDFVIHLRSFQGGIEYAYYQGIISPAYTILEPQNPNYSGFYKYLFKSYPYIQLLKTCVTGIREGQNIDYNVLGNKHIPLPPAEEQEAIVRYITEKSEKIDRYVAEQERLLGALEELRQAEIARAVTRGLNSDAPLRDSGIDWIGPIPAHWETLYLFQTAKEHYISNKDIHHQNLLSLSYGKIIRKDINKTDGLLPASFDGYQIVEPGNIVLRLTDLQNDQKSLRVGQVKEEGIVTSAYLAIEPTTKTISDYLYLHLHTYDIHKVFYGMGGGLRQGLNWSGIRHLKIVIPPLEEQRAIVEYLDEKTAKIDRMKAEVVKKIDLLKEYKQRMISDAVTGKIDVRE